MWFQTHFKNIFNFNKQYPLTPPAPFRIPMRLGKPWFSKIAMNLFFFTSDYFCGIQNCREQGRGCTKIKTSYRKFKWGFSPNTSFLNSLRYVLESLSNVMQLHDVSVVHCLRDLVHCTFPALTSLCSAGAVPAKLLAPHFQILRLDNVIINEILVYVIARLFFWTNLKQLLTQSKQSCIVPKQTLKPEGNEVKVVYHWIVFMFKIYIVN